MLGYDDTSHYSETEIGIDDFLDAFNGVYLLRFTIFLLFLNIINASLILN